MELELKHLAAYLPYKLKIIHAENVKVMNLGHGSSVHWIGLQSVISWQNRKARLRPILRKLSDLAKEVKVNGEKFVPIEKIKSDYFIKIEGVVGEDLRVYCFLRDTTLTKSIWDMPYELIVQLTEWHFDIFNLIPNGLAIDINTLNNQS